MIWPTKEYMLGVDWGVEMKFYIGTVYVLTTMVEMEIGDAGIRRFVARFRCESAAMFKATIMDRYIHDVDATVDFGPVSLSKNQE